jgi:hypothetical protein
MVPLNPATRKCSANSSNSKSPIIPHKERPIYDTSRLPNLSLTYSHIVPVFSTFMSFTSSLKHIHRSQFLNSSKLRFLNHNSLSTSFASHTTNSRIMSTVAAPEKLDWLVILPDHEGVLAKRMEVRQCVPRA